MPSAGGGIAQDIATGLDQLGPDGGGQQSIFTPGSHAFTYEITTGSDSLSVVGDQPFGVVISATRRADGSAASVSDLAGGLTVQIAFVAPSLGSTPTWMGAVNLAANIWQAEAVGAAAAGSALEAGAYYALVQTLSAGDGSLLDTYVLCALRVY